ncbi:MAG: hypothetical protein L3J29_08770 [Cyclobacteriaceae bacterium]|nr:hypothetical protein [Cyclobacteriaceae bacterium]
MATKAIHNLTHSFYFVTITCFKWLSLFETSKIYGYFPKWIDQMNKRGVTISGYVIMPNHLHLLVFLRPQCTNLNVLIGNSKRFLAYEIVKRLKEAGQKKTLDILTNGVMPEEQKKGKPELCDRVRDEALSHNKSGSLDSKA